MNRNVWAPLILSVFIFLPLVVVFQNCAGGSVGFSNRNPESGDQASLLPPLKVSGAMTPGGRVDVFAFDFSPDGGHLVFVADREVKDRPELWAVGRDGTGLIKLSAGGVVEAYRVIGDSVVYTEALGSGTVDLFRIGINGSGRRVLTGGLAPGRGVGDFAVSEGRNLALFVADLEIVGVPELYSVKLDVASPPLKLHPGLASPHGMRDLKLLSDWVLVRGRTTGGTATEELYVVRFDGTGFHRVSLPAVAGAEGVGKFDGSRDGSSVVYLSDIHQPGTRELFATDVNGASTTQLNAQPVWGGSVSDFKLAPTMDAVVFTGAIESPGKIEIYGRDLLSAGPAIKLNPTLIANGDVEDFTVFAQVQLVNGAPVLRSGLAFVADATLDDKLELFVTTDLSAMASKVSGAMGQAGDILDFAIAPNGERVLYVADQDYDTKFELYSKNLDPAGAFLKVVSGGENQDIVPPLGFNIDGTRTFFVGDLERDLQRQLYVTGAGGSTRLVSRAKSRECDVHAFKVSQDGKWIAYAADHDESGVIELFVAPIPDP